MARLPYVDPAEASPRVREALEIAPPLNLFRMIAHADTALRPILRLGGALLAESQLDDKLRELVILRVAQESRAEYEWLQHVAIGKAVGVTDDQVAAIERGDVEADCFDDTERLVLGFATEVIRDVGASDATFQRVADAFSPREIVEMILTVGFYMMVARVMETTALDLDEPVGAAALNAVTDTAD